MRIIVGAVLNSKDQQHSPDSMENKTNMDMEVDPLIENMDFPSSLQWLSQFKNPSHLLKSHEENPQIMQKIFNLCVKHQAWESLEQCMALLQKQSVIVTSAQKFVQNTLEILKSITDKNVCYRLAKTILSTCNGRLHLEREHVQVTKFLAQQYNLDGKYTEAADVLSELKIEAYAISQREKVKFLLLQMDMLLQSNQLEKTRIISKMIQTKFFDDLQNEDLKIKYYGIQVLPKLENSYLGTSKHYHILSWCKTLSEETRTNSMVNAAIFCALSVKSSEQINWMKVLLKELEGSIACDLLRFFSSLELICMNDVQNSFQAAATLTKVMTTISTSLRAKWLCDLNLRVIEHNILIIVKYYSRIHLVQMAELIGTSVPICKENITRLISNGRISSKMNNLTGVLDSSDKCVQECVLNNCLDAVNRVMVGINQASYHVQKELSVNAVIDRTK